MSAVTNGERSHTGSSAISGWMFISIRAMVACFGLFISAVGAGLIGNIWSLQPVQSVLVLLLALIMGVVVAQITRRVEHSVAVFIGYLMVAGSVGMVSEALVTRIAPDNTLVPIFAASFGLTFILGIIGTFASAQLRRLSPWLLGVLSPVFTMAFFHLVLQQRVLTGLGGVDMLAVALFTGYAAMHWLKAESGPLTLDSALNGVLDIYLIGRDQAPAENAAH